MIDILKKKYDHSLILLTYTLLLTTHTLYSISSSLCTAYRLFLFVNSPKFVFGVLPQPIKDTPEKLQSAECLGILEALASCFVFDIAGVEAKHNSNREMTLLNNRGWVPSLQSLTSKFVCKCAGQLSKRFKFAFGLDPKAPTTTTESNRSDQTAVKKVLRTGGGGPWRVFCHHRAQGQKFSAEMLQQLSREYNSLSNEERRVYEQAGLAAVEARKRGFRSFESENKKPKKLNNQPLQPGEMTPLGAIVAQDRTTELESLLVYSGKDEFLDAYEKLKIEIRNKNKDNSSDLTEQELQTVALFETNAKQTDFVETLSELGHKQAAESFQATGSRSTNLVSLEWFPPVSNICQAWTL